VAVQFSVGSFSITKDHCKMIWFAIRIMPNDFSNIAKLLNRICM